MKDRAVVSERGTITIPEPIRESAHIYPGDLVEFETFTQDRIVLRHLVVKCPGDETFMDDRQWDRFDKIVQKQLKKGQYIRYSDLEKTKAHSRKLMRKIKL